MTGAKPGPKGPRLDMGQKKVNLTIRILPSYLAKLKANQDLTGHSAGVQIEKALSVANQWDAPKRGNK